MKPVAAGGNPAEDLVKARALLPVPAAGRSRLSGGALRRALVELHDYWLGGHAVRAGIGAQGVALLAVGALGRRELMPHSDLDLILVHDAERAGSAELNGIAERLWYPLWDAGIGIDHSVRTITQAVGAAGEDIRTALGLLDARHIAGDETVSAELRAAARANWRAGIRRRFGELVDSAKVRWERCGEIAQRAEPDLKNGRGGSRDVELLYALATAQLLDRPGEEVRTAHELVLDVRTELRRVSSRTQDVLRAQDGDEVAESLGIVDRFALARALSGAGRAISYATGVALRATTPAASHGGRRRKATRHPLDDGVVLHGTGASAEVALARDAEPASDPALLLRVAAAAARTRMPISSSTLTRLANSAPELREPWPRAARTKLIELLGAGSGLVDVVEALDATGLWGRLFGEWSAIRDLPPRDANHVWTVDRHLVQTCVRAADLTTSVSRPDLLLLGALLHDIGKGRQTDHSEIGAALTTQVGRRLGLPGADVTTLTQMVRHHLLLPKTATTRDTTDPTTVELLSNALGDDPVLLELLAALTTADSMATGPGVWTPWKAKLIDDLATRCRSRMAGESLPVSDPLTAAQEALLAKVTESRRPELVLTEHEDGGLVTVAALDRARLISRVAGVLALHSLVVHEATLRSYGDMALDVFAVSPRFGSFPPAELLAEHLVRALDGSLPLAERIAAKERDYLNTAAGHAPARVHWFTREASEGVVFELRALDRIGLLYRVAVAVEGCGLDLRWAKAVSFGATAVYACCLAGPKGSTPARAQLREVEQALLASAS